MPVLDGTGGVSVDDLTLGRGGDRGTGADDAGGERGHATGRHGGDDAGRVRAAVGAEVRHVHYGMCAA